MYNISSTNNLEGLLNREIVEAAKKLATAHHDSKVKWDENKTTPNTGVQYPIPYMKALKETNETPRFQWFRREGLHFRGYLKGFDYIRK